MKTKFIKYIFLAIVIFIANLSVAYIKHNDDKTDKLSSSEKTPEIFAGKKEIWTNKICEKLISEKNNLLLHKVTQESCIAVAKPTFDGCAKDYESSIENITQKNRLEKFSICFINKLESELRKQE